MSDHIIEEDIGTLKSEKDISIYWKYPIVLYNLTHSISLKHNVKLLFYFLIRNSGKIFVFFPFIRNHLRKRNLYKMWINQQIIYYNSSHIPESFFLSFTLNNFKIQSLNANADNEF